MRFRLPHRKSPGCVALLAATLLTACHAHDGEMEPGEACMECHRPSGDADDVVFSAAGTVFEDGAGDSGAQGVTVTITDVNGTVATLESNAVGNFYTEQSLAAPLTVALTKGSTSKSMAGAAADGDCNRCHQPDGDVGAYLVFP